MGSEQSLHVLIGRFEEHLNALEDKVARDWDHHVLQLLDRSILLVIIELTYIVELVNDELFDVCFIYFRTALEAKDTVFDCPDLILGSITKA